MSHLETLATTHSRKSQRVYRSPSSSNDPSPYSKKKEEKKLMDIDAEDEEAGTILMALAQHASRIMNENNNKSSSMSIRNLLDNEAKKASANESSILPFHSLPADSKPFYESRLNSNLKKGFQICLTQRHPPVNDESDEDSRSKEPKSFRHPSTLRTPPTANHMAAKFKRNATHIHISYRIHAHKTSLSSRPIKHYENNAYPSAFRPAHSTSSSTSINSHYRDWSHNSSHSLSSYN